MLRDLKKAEENERTFADVTEFSFSKDGKTLVCAVASRKEEDNGIYAVSPEGSAAPVALLRGKGKYTRLTWDPGQTQLAFLSDRDDAGAKQPSFKLYHWNRRTETAAELVSAATPGFRSEYVLSERGPISFSRDGKRLC